MGLHKWLQPKKVYLLSKWKRKNAQTCFCQCKEHFSKRFMIIEGFSYIEKLKIRRMRKMLNITQSAINNKFCVRYLQKKFHFFTSMTFIEWNSIKTKYQATLRKMPLHFLKKRIRLIHALNVYTFNIFLQSPLTFHPCTIVPLIYWKKNKPLTTDGSWKLWKRNRNQCFGKFYEKPFDYRIPMQTYSPKTRLSGWTFKKNSFYILNIN